MKHLERHLSVANVLSCLALFVALSGAAVAAGVAKNSVKTRHLGKGAVTTPKLRNGAVKTPKLRNGAVTTPKLRNGAVVTTKLADGSVRAIDLGGGVVTTPKLKNGAVSELKLLNGAVTNSKLGANAVATGKIEDGAITGAKLSPTFLAQLVKNVSYATKASTSDDEEDRKTITADCPAGKQVTGGGAAIVGLDADNVVLRESAPVVDVEGKRTGWRATAWETAAEASPWSVEAYAICAEL
ncbi:MAG TPA: hypothetical protein VFZ41_09425 [Solirubrobacterales bacterium]